MGKNSKVDAWAEAKRLCPLSADDIAKAKALGMSPRSLLLSEGIEVGQDERDGMLAATGSDRARAARPQARALPAFPS